MHPDLERVESADLNLLRGGKIRTNRAEDLGHRLVCLVRAPSRLAPFRLHV